MQARKNIKVSDSAICYRREEVKRWNIWISFEEWGNVQK